MSALRFHDGKTLVRAFPYFLSEFWCFVCSLKSLKFTMIKIQVRTTLRFLMLVLTEAFLWSHCGEKLEYLKKT